MLKKIAKLTASRDVCDYWTRRRFCTRYSWAIPSREAIELLVSLSPLVEIGAGNGLWAHLVARAGGDIIAYDTKPPHKRGRNTYMSGKAWYSVHIGGPRKVLKTPNRTLFLCWPPYNTDMAHETLKLYRGNTVALIGEGHGGCTGCDDFHSLLGKEFTCTNELSIPQWFGLHDYLSVWERK
jgi:hypothetical protein